MYIGGEVGIADLGTANSNLISQDAITRNPAFAPLDQSYDTTDFAWGVRGGVRPLQKGAFDFGLELAYQNFGTAEYDVTNVEDSVAENGYRDVEIEAVSGFLTGQYNHGNADYTEEGPLELPSNANDINMISIGLNVGNFADR